MQNKAGYYFAICCLLWSLSLNVKAAIDYSVGANVKFEFDDNVFKRDLDDISNSSDEQSGTVLSKGAAVDFNGDWSKIQLVSGVKVNETEYFEQPELDNQTYSFSIDMDYFFSERLLLSSSYDNSRIARSFSDLDSIQKSEVDNKVFDLGFIYKVNSLIDLKSNFSTSESRNLAVNLSNLDSYRKSYQIGADIKASSKLVVEILHKRTDSISIGNENDLLDFSEKNSGVVLKYSYSPKTIIVLDLSRQSLSDNDVLNYTMDVTYSMSPKSIFSVSSFKRTVDSLNVSSLKTENTGANFRYNYLYSSKLNMGIVTSRSSVKADGSLSDSVDSYTDELFNLSLIANYIFNKNIIFTFGYIHQNRNSSRTGFDFESNVVQFNSNFKF